MGFTRSTLESLGSREQEGFQSRSLVSYIYNLDREPVRVCDQAMVKQPRSGHDPILGLSNRNGSRERFFTLKLGNGKKHTIRLEKDWVIPTGAGYFFAPSISALYVLSGGASPSEI